MRTLEEEWMLPAFKRALPHLVALAACTCIPSAAMAAQGLVAAYGFGEGQGTSTSDASGNGLVGTATNTTWVSGKFGKALHFNGKSNSRVTVADSPLLRLTSAYTLSAWVNPQQSQPTEPAVIFKQIPGDLAYALYSKGDGIGPNAWTRSSGTYHSVAAINTVPVNTWTNLTATFDGTTLSVYVNGTLANSAAAQGAIDTGNGVLRIGNNSVFANEGFVGAIDEVRIYNRALSAAEILNDMAVPVSETPPIDTVGPNGTIRIDGGATSTNQTMATLTLSASDASGVSQMRFSSDGVTFAAPVPFATTAAAVLSSGDGVKTEYVQFQDTVGNWSNSFSASITLDTVAPSLSGISATSVTPTTAAIAWTTNEVANSAVEYGTTSAYGQASPVGSALLLSHSVGLNGLSPATLYHFRVRSSDGAGNESVSGDSTFTTSTQDAAIPQLGAHILLTQDESLGTQLATTPAIDTQVSGSSLIAVTMGWKVNFATPFDSYNNTWTPATAMNLYAGTDFYTSAWAAPFANGGNNHTLSVTKNGRPAGEISMELMEVINGGDVRLIYRLAPAGDETPGSITVDGPATLIAIWAGDSFELSHTAVPDNGFVVFDSYLNLGPSSGVQVAFASKQVTTPGTYTVNWASTPFQNAACYLIAVQRPH